MAWREQPQGLWSEPQLSGGDVYWLRDAAKKDEAVATAVLFLPDARELSGWSLCELHERPAAVERRLLGFRQAKSVLDGAGGVFLR